MDFASFVRIKVSESKSSNLWKFKGGVDRMKIPKQILVEMEKELENLKKKMLERIHPQTRLNYMNKFLILESKISASKERWKEEMEFLKELKNVKPLSEYYKFQALPYNQVVENRIAELNGVSK